jgi:polysaccharide export outer membrane protein
MSRVRPVRAGLPKIEKKSYCFSGTFPPILYWLMKPVASGHSPMVLNVHKPRLALMHKTFWGFLVFMLVIGMAQDKAIPKDLAQYVRDARKAGLSDTQIQQNAVKAGWAAAAVADAMVLPAQDEKPAVDVKQASNAPEPAPGTAPGRPANPAAAWDPANNPASLTTLKPPDGGTKTAPPETGQPKSASSSAVPPEYRIGEGDVLQISVMGEPTASVASAVVRTDGKISMPLIKEIAVVGLTPTEVEKTVTEQLSKMIRVPDVTVIVSQSNSQKIFMVGAVKKEGPLHYTYRMTVIQAISEAGGLTDYAKRKRIYVIRSENGRQFQFPFDYDAVMKGQHMEMNRILEPGDTVVVPH